MMREDQVLSAVELLRDFSEEELYEIVRRLRSVPVPAEEGGPVSWSWNDGIGNRSRKPACLVATRAGDIYRFTGEDVPGVARVVSRAYEQNGKWSNTTYSVISPPGTTTIQWIQSWEDGLFWPQAYWEDAITWVQEQAPRARAEAVEDLIRGAWRKAAIRFDENRAAQAEMSA